MAAAFMARAPLMRHHRRGVVVPAGGLAHKVRNATSTSPRLNRRRRPKFNAHHHRDAATSAAAAVSNANEDDAVSIGASSPEDTADAADAADDADAAAAHEDPGSSPSMPTTREDDDADAVDVDDGEEKKAKRGKGAVVWFRQDLRLDDNQAFRAAVRAANRRGGNVVCVYVWSEEEEGDAHASWAPGEASRVWLHHSLAALDRDLRTRFGGRRGEDAHPTRGRLQKFTQRVFAQT